MMLSLQGKVLSLAGRLNEAEQCYRQALAESQGDSRSGRAIHLTDLGSALTDLGRYDEARQCLESAMQLEDGIGSAQCDMAELLLMQGIEPARALDLIGQAVQIKQRSAVTRRVDRQIDGERWANKAWALALLGRAQEAEEAIEHALREADQDFRPVLAGVHWRIGMALVALSRTEKAIEHFRTAAAIDPNGKYGGFAGGQLKQQSVWGR